MIAAVTIAGSVVVLLFVGLAIVVASIVATAVRIGRDQRAGDDNHVRLDDDQ